MDREYFEISTRELQNLAKWSADCAFRSLALFENRVPSDDRPRRAIEAAKEFALSGKRTNALRKIAMDAFRASSVAEDSAASLAAQSAGFAAASAYTHPFPDVHQAKHILGPAVCSALALELASEGVVSVGDEAIEKAVAAAPSEVVSLLAKMPHQPQGRDRKGDLYAKIDSALRGGRNGRAV